MPNSTVGCSENPSDPQAFYSFPLGFSGNKAESIFAKYRNQQNQGTSSDAPVVPSGQSDDVGALPERPVEVTSSRPPVAPSSRQSK